MLNLRARTGTKSLVAFLTLALLLMVGSVAAFPADTSKSVSISVDDGANPGEAVITWTAGNDVRYYRVGWISMQEYETVTGAGRPWFEAFHFVDLENIGQTFYTAKGLTPGERYAFALGSKSDYYGEPVWLDIEFFDLANQHGAGFCPITGLQIPQGGYLNVGDTMTWTDATFTLDSATSPTSVSTTTGAYTPPEGRQLVQLCSTQSNLTGNNLYFQVGIHNNVSTDRGIGFARVTGWDDQVILNGQTESACDAWSVPATATTAIYAISDGDNPDVLYRIDLTATPSTDASKPSAGAQQTPFNLAEFDNGTWLESRYPRLADRLRAISWVQDGVTETEADAVQQLLYLAYYDSSSTAQVLQMPFLQTFQTADRHAIAGITEIFRDGLGQTLTQTQIYRNGITDVWTPAVAAAAATESAGAIAEYLDARQATTETKTFSTSHTDNLTVSIVRPAGVTPVPQTVNMFQNAAQLTEVTMALQLPTDHIIAVFDDRAVIPGYRGMNHGFAIGIQQDAELAEDEYRRRSLQNSLHHEVAHYWWRGNANWIDEGLADTIAATASLAQGHALAAQPNRRKHCTARNLSEIGSVTTADPGQFHCNYYLGEKLFRAVQSKMTAQEFTAALQNLYRASRAKPRPTQRDQVRADIVDVRRVFEAHTDVVEYHWSGDVNAPHRWDSDDNLYQGHNAVEWTQKPTYSNGVVSFSGRLTGPATLSSQTLLEAQHGGYSNFTISDSEGNYLGSILPSLSGGRHWTLNDPGDVVADTYHLDGNEFSVRFRWPAGVGQYQDKHVTVWGFNNAARTPESSAAVDVLSASIVR